MYLISKNGTEIYDLTKYDRLMLLHEGTIAIARKGELYSIGKFDEDEAHKRFAAICTALANEDMVFSFQTSNPSNG